MTRMMKRALINWAFRVFVFIFIFGAYLFRKEMLINFMTHEFTFGISEYGISPLHVLWGIFMLMMLQHILPNKELSMAFKKGKVEEYERVYVTDVLQLCHLECAPYQAVGYEYEQAGTEYLRALREFLE